MREGIVFMGGGGHCKSVIDSAVRSGKYDKIVITDPDIKPGEKILGCEVVGTDDMLPALRNEGFRNAFITVGSLGACDVRENLYKLAKDAGFSFPNIVDPSAVVSDSAKLGEGIFIGKNAAVNAEVVIGDHVIINTGAIIEHECIVEAYTHVAVGAVLCGGCRLGTNTLVGAGTTLIQCVSVGSGSIVGAGSVVIRDVPAGVTVAGSPARTITS